jgi:hypothetical protein
MQYAAPPSTGGGANAGGGGGNAAAAAAPYMTAEPSAQQQIAKLGRMSFRTSNRSVIEGLASIYQVKTVLGSGAWQRRRRCFHVPALLHQPAAHMAQHARPAGPMHA